jgi:hypothetical protein
MQRDQFYERQRIDPATQFVDEGCYSWGMCDVLTSTSPRNCSYITVFRAPKERLVSAFVYCIYKQPRDQCCGWNRMFQDKGCAALSSLGLPGWLARRVCVRVCVRACVRACACARVCVVRVVARRTRCRAPLRALQVVA